MDNEPISELSRGKPGGHKPIDTVLAEEEQRTQRLIQQLEAWFALRLKMRQKQDNHEE